MSKSQRSSKKQSSWVMRLFCCGSQVDEAPVSDINHCEASKSTGDLDAVATEQELEEIVKAFTACDANGDGFISCEELRNLLRRFNKNQSEAHLTAIIKSVDFDRDGRVSFEEFKTVFGRMLKVKKIEAQDSDDMKCAFKVFDHDNDGYITLPEIKLAMSFMGEMMDDKQAQQMLDMADSNKDGKISEDEFVNIFSVLKNQMESNTNATIEQ